MFFIFSSVQAPSAYSDRIRSVKLPPHATSEQCNDSLIHQVVYWCGTAPFSNTRIGTIENWSKGWHKMALHGLSDHDRM